MITDFYNNFFSHFGISESEFIQYGISETIFPDKDKAYDDWKQKKEDFLKKRNGNFYIRSDKGERWSKGAYPSTFASSFFVSSLRFFGEKTSAWLAQRRAKLKLFVGRSAIKSGGCHAVALAKADHTRTAHHKPQTLKKPESHPA